MNEEINLRFITVIYPYIAFDNRINELEKHPNLKAQNLNNSIWKIQSKN